MSGEAMIIDSFAGGGGASTGIEMALGRSPDVAINHSADALAMHQVNHPETLHLDSNIWDVSPSAGRQADHRHRAGLVLRQLGLPASRRRPRRGQLRASGKAKRGGGMRWRLDHVLMWLFLAGSAWKSFGPFEFLVAAALVFASVELGERWRR